MVPLNEGALVVSEMIVTGHLPQRRVNFDRRFMTIWQARASAWKLVGHQTVALSK